MITSRYDGDISLELEMRVLHHKMDYLLETIPHLHGLTQSVAIGKTKGYQFEKSKTALEEASERLNKNIDAIIKDIDNARG